ncbi:hypothetical protein HPP92_025028 [Vanilla planifolia]|uniref:Nucleotide exchange factor Fes1 domain-containing protein n=1 Tax=Vanilla planifolia TaxID=51239 RepID=A0A835PHT0_VANPL|nr:hypothetical protein HPP92_025319 [Vanilla planifolia]KAG0453724.1 hypothetical protein HPP92_025028 [Vanilla planifolia]
MGSSLAAATLQLKHTKLENCRKRWRRHCVLNKQFLSPNQSFLSQIRSSDNAASQYGVATSLHFNYMLPFFVDLHVLYQIKRGGNTKSQGSFSSFRLVVLSFRFLDYSLRTSLMDKSPLCIILFLLLTLSVVTSTNAVSEDQFNKSSLGAILWASGKDDSDLLAAVDPDDNYGLGEKEGEMTGGFSSIEGMLQWAIGHSDPEKLKEKASDVQRLSSAEMKKRQLEIQDLMAKLKMPSDAELMKIAITDLNNASISLEDRQRALNELLTLVEPVDNANDLNKLGGLVAVVQQLENSESEIRTTSAWILGKACQNTAVAQNQILELGVLERLMKMVKSASAEEAIKALYAISALIRNNENGQELFYSENGYLMLQDIMSDNSNDVRLQKKAVLLVADLANSYQQETVGSAELLHVGDRLFLKTVIDLAMTNDVDLMEKALLATKSLLLLPSTNALDFKDFCGLEKVLDRIKLQLEELSTELGDYAKEMESLRREVHIIFHRKQEKVSWVPS